MGSSQLASVAAVGWTDGGEGLRHLGLFTPGSPLRAHFWDSRRRCWTTGALPDGPRECEAYGGNVYWGAFEAPVALLNSFAPEPDLEHEPEPAPAQGTPQLDLCFRGDDGNLYRQQGYLYPAQSDWDWTGGWWNLAVAQGLSFGAPPAVVTSWGSAAARNAQAAGQRIDLLANSGGTVYWGAGDGGYTYPQRGCRHQEALLPFSGVTPGPPGGAVGSPAAVRCARDRLDAVIRDRRGALWHATRRGTWFDPSPAWQGWTPLPPLPPVQSITAAAASLAPSTTPAVTAATPTAAATPVLLSLRPHTIDLFVLGSDGATWHVPYAGDRWGGRQSLQAQTAAPPAASAPTVVGDEAGRLDAVWRNQDGSVQHTWRAPGQSWQTERLAGLVATGIPAVVGGDPRRLDVFAAGAQGTVWHRTYDGTRWSPAWEAPLT